MLLFLLVVLLLGGCSGGGDGEGGSGTVSAPARATAPGTAPATAPTPRPEVDSRSAPPRPRRQESIEGEPLPGAKAVAPGVPIVRGGDNTIQAFGVEGEEDESARAYVSLRAYLAALRAKEMTRACALASSEFRKQLARLIEQAKTRGNAEKPDGCAGVLQVLFGGIPEDALGVLTQAGELLSFRVEGDYAYLIFRGSQGKAMFVAMANEEGGWRVNVPQPEGFSMLVPAGQGSAQ